MGGVIFLLSTVITSLFYIKDYPKIIPVLFLTLGFGIIGFLDDYLKVVLRRSDGLMPGQKMACQIVVTAIFAFYIMKFTDVQMTLKIPFVSGYELNAGILTVPLLFFVVIGTVNGVNFTDGLDGLASSVTIMVATFFSVIAIATKSGIEPITCAVVGALMGFLLFNVYPAKIFMGDTGSMALGGAMSAMVIYSRSPFLFLLMGVCIVASAVSVVLQVGSFKLRHGKRIFKMAPLHHHFELLGYPETKVVSGYMIVTALACVAALALFL